MAIDMMEYRPSCLKRAENSCGRILSNEAHGASALATQTNGLLTWDRPPSILDGVKRGIGMLSRFIAVIVALVALFFGIGWETTQGQIDYVVTGTYNDYRHDLTIARDVLVSAGAVSPDVLRQVSFYIGEAGGAAGAGGQLATVAQPGLTALAAMNVLFSNSIATAETAKSSAAAKDFLVGELDKALVRLPHGVNAVSQLETLGGAVDSLSKMLQQATATFSAAH